METGVFFVFFLALIAHHSLAEPVAFESCPTTDEDAAPAWNCTVHEVRINPCAEAAEEKPCKIKRGKSASIQFDFTPDFNSDAATAGAYWTNALVDLPFAGMNTEGCSNTQCPLVAGRKQSYVYDLSISKKFPVRTYDVKWRLYNEGNLECCFITKIKLVK